MNRGDDIRKLTIHRKKQFVASAVKVRICLKTESKGDIQMQGFNLSVVATLKNGKSLTIEIPFEETEVYVVYDKFLPQKFHTKYSLDSGETEEILYVSSRFSPFKGNPFSISKNKILTLEDKDRVREIESNKQVNTKSKLLYWTIIGVSIIIGLFVGYFLAS